jgi:hypothetical protein
MMMMNCSNRSDEADKFFIKEMELKRNYRTVRSKNRKDYEVKKNGLLNSETN